MSDSRLVRRAIRFLGLELNRTSHIEKLVSAIGGLLGILSILLISVHALDVQDAALIVASMGASAVLLFGVPHGPLSQPWPVLGGHIVSGLIGVTCSVWISEPLLAGPVAVGLAIGTMHYLRCIHPPGGATALTAVIGGPSVQALGYQFLLTPVLANALVILATAILVNYPFRWRRYPASLVRHNTRSTRSQRAAQEEETGESFTHDDLEHALREMNLTLDVDEMQLQRIYRLANQHARSAHLSPTDIQIGHYYSNGQFGDTWSVRRVVDGSDDPRPQNDVLIFKVVAGQGRRSSGSATREEFARWARHEVFLNENSWQRVGDASSVTPMPQPASVGG